VGIDDAVSHARPGGKVEDRVEAAIRKDRLDLVEVLDVRLDEAEALARLQRAEPMALHPHVVGVVEIVETDDLDSPVEQQPRDPRGDEAGNAGDESGFHGRDRPQSATLAPPFRALS